MTHGVEATNLSTINELALVKEPGAVPIQLPTDIPVKFSHPKNENYARFCLWCGYAYEKYSRQLENEDFAYRCPNAPDRLRHEEIMPVH